MNPIRKIYTRQLHTKVFTKNIEVDLIYTVSRCLELNCLYFFYWLQMTWTSGLTGSWEWPFLKTLTNFTQLGTNLDLILNYSNINNEWKKRLIQGCVKFEQALPQLRDFFVDCKHRPFVNEHYLNVQGIILYHSWDVVENLFRKKETTSRLCHSRAVSLLLLKYKRC